MSLSPVRCRYLFAAVLLALPAPLLAQDPDSSQVATPDTAAPVKKKKGLFGKIKDIANDKTVQSVTKAAACAGVVPGASQVAQMSGKCVPGVPGGAGVPGASALSGVPGAAVAEALGGAAALGRGRSPGVPTGMLGGGDVAVLQRLTREMYRAMGRGVDEQALAKVMMKYSNNTGAPAMMSAADAEKAIAALAALPGDAKRAATPQAQMARAQAEMLDGDPSQ